MEGERQKDGREKGKRDGRWEGYDKVKGLRGTKSHS